MSGKYGLTVGSRRHSVSQTGESQVKRRCMDHGGVRMLKLSDIMTKEVVTVTPQTTLRDTVELFTARHISGAPVVSGNSIVGIISAADVLGFAASTPDTPTGRPEQGEWDVNEAAVEEETERSNFAPRSYYAEL